jgi:hypothetical protein
LDQQLGKRASLNISSSHHFVRYSTDEHGDSHAAQAGVGGEYQLNKWLFLSVRYSTYLNTINERYRTATIQRIQVGGIRVKTRRGLEIFSSAEVEYSKYLGVSATRASFQGGFSKTLGSTALSLAYHRGLSTAVGWRTTMDGDHVVASLGQPLSRRVFLRADSAYTRGGAIVGDARLKALSTTVTLEVAIQRHLLLSTNYWYIDQQANGLPSSHSNIRRYAATIGLQYFLPSLLDR